MIIICLNCGHTFKGNFCPHCGQNAKVQRLTATALITDTFHFFTHLDTGFLFTTWSFLTRPGVSSLKYIAGKRKEYQKPVSYFLIWTGLFILLHNTIINHYHYQLGGEIVAQMNIREPSNIEFRRHFTLFIIPIILLSALLLYYILGKPHYNFIELLTLSLYGAGTYFMLSLVSDLILGVVFKVNILTDNVFLWQGILSSLYNLWFSFDFFSRLRLRFFWVRLIGVSLLIAISGWLIMFFLPVAWMSLTR